MATGQQGDKRLSRSAPGDAASVQFGEAASKLEKEHAAAWQTIASSKEYAQYAVLGSNLLEERQATTVALAAKDREREREVRAALGRHERDLEEERERTRSVRNTYETLLAAKAREGEAYRALAVWALGGAAPLETVPLDARATISRALQLLRQERPGEIGPAPGPVQSVTRWLVQAATSPVKTLTSLVAASPPVASARTEAVEATSEEPAAESSAEGSVPLPQEHKKLVAEVERLQKELRRAKSENARLRVDAEVAMLESRAATGATASQSKTAEPAEVEVAEVVPVVPSRDNGTRSAEQNAWAESMALNSVAELLKSVQTALQLHCGEPAFVLRALPLLASLTNEGIIRQSLIQSGVAYKLLTVSARFPKNEAIQANICSAFVQLFPQDFRDGQESLSSVELTAIEYAIEIAATSITEKAELKRPKAALSAVRLVLHLVSINDAVVDTKITESGARARLERFAQAFLSRSSDAVSSGALATQAVLTLAERHQHDLKSLVMSPLVPILQEVHGANPSMLFLPTAFPTVWAKINKRTHAAGFMMRKLQEHKSKRDLRKLVDSTVGSGASFSQASSPGASSTAVVPTRARRAESTSVMPSRRPLVSPPSALPRSDTLS